MSFLGMSGARELLEIIDPWSYSFLVKLSIYKERSAKNKKKNMLADITFLYFENTRRFEKGVFD